LRVNVETLSKFFQLWAEAFDKGTGIYFVLWMVILALMLVIWSMLRSYNKRLAHCEEQHAYQLKLTAALQKKLAIAVGMLASALGNRAPPAGFWKAMMDDEATEIPAWDVAQKP